MRALKSVLVCVFAMLVVGVAPAFGAFTYPFDGQLVPSSGEFGDMFGSSIAVDDENGDTYVAESTAGVVDVFETASGTELAPLDGALTPAGSFGGGGVVVAANNGTGDVYVLDSADDVVDVFEPSGGYAGQIVGGETPAKSFNDPRGIAVDQKTGEVYVADTENGVVDIFSAGGVYTGRQLSLANLGSFTERRPSIAVDDFNGDVYIVARLEGSSKVDEFDAVTGEYVTTWTGANTPGGGFNGGQGVAADNANGDVYVADPEHGVTDVFGPSGEYVTQFISHSSETHTHTQGVGVDQASGKVYVSGPEEAPGYVDIFGPAVVVPSVVTGLATEVRGTSATLNGTVNPEGIELADCRFEYGAEGSYGQSVPCVPAAGAIPVDSEEHAVSADIAGLAPGSTYHFRLEASNANGPNFGGDATVSTPPAPSIEGAAAVNVVGASADLTAKIDPNGFDTTYRFEWGTSTAYGTSVPVPDADIGAGTSAVPVSTHLLGLSANTTYHWRVLATNENGTSVTGDQTFVYDTSGVGLPDGRAYEMVTPPRKNGASLGVVFPGTFTDVAEDGSRVIVPSIQCFGDSVGCNGDRYTQGDPFAFTRTSGGWVVTPLAPSASQFNVNNSWMYSADADTALFSVPASSGSERILARQPDGLFLNIGPMLIGGAEFSPGAKQATADLSHVVYAGPVPYEYVGSGNAAPVLVGVSGGVGSTDLIGECGARLGNGQEGQFNALSADGDTVFFTVGGPCASGTGANAGVPVPADTVYARIDEARTVLISGRSPLGCTGACLGSPAAAAKFMGASEDGSKAFFTSPQQLTDDASEESVNLYEYDFDDPAGRNLVAVSAGDASGGGPRVQGVVAISSDGSHVYFVAQGVLSAVANGRGQVAQNGGENLYVFERDASHPGGHVVFVATLSPSDQLNWYGFPTGIGGTANVTPDGRFLVFVSYGALTADDSSTTGAGQVFRYDAQTGELVRVSIGENGFNDNGNAGESGANIVSASSFLYRAGPPRPDPTMSNDGSFVFFMSPVGLTPRALNEVQVGGGQLAQNVYEWHDGHVYLISDGRDASRGHFTSCAILGLITSECLIGSDGTGANVFFSTADQLVPQDTDTQLDVYDARICTASEPCTGPAAPVASCQGEACHGTPGGTPGGAPALAGAGSAAFVGPGNLASPTPMAAHKQAAVKKHVKRKSRHRRPKKRKKTGAKGRKAAHGGGKRGGRR